VTVPIRRPVPVPFVAGIECSYLPTYDVDVTETNGHQTHLAADLAAAGAHVEQIRYPIRWPRVEVEPGRFDWSATDAALDAVGAAGLAPIVDLLHHTSHPGWLQDGLRDRRFGPAFVRFVQAVVERYPWVPAYTVINEPLTTFLMAGHESMWPPYDAGLEGFARLATNTMPAVVEAAAACRAGWPTAEHVWVDTCEHHAAVDAADPRAHAALANDRRHAVLDLVLHHDLDRPRPFLDALRRAGGERLFELPAIQIDVLGLDYYWQLEWWYDELGGHCPSPQPVGFAALAEHYADRYGLPVMLTETNVRGLPSDRVSWLRYILEQCETALARGVDLRGLCWYPLVDSCDWDSLLARNAGRVDPVGVWSIDRTRDPDRLRTVFTTWWESATSGARAADLPAYRFSSPLREQLRGFQPQMADWPWIDPPEPPTSGRRAEVRRGNMITTRTDANAPATRLAAFPVAARDLVVLSHLRWTWVWQRPQHLISRFAETRNANGAHTWFVEEPLFADVDEPVLRTEAVDDGITRVWLDVPTPDPAPMLPEFDMPVAASYPERLADYLDDVRDAGLPVDVWLHADGLSPDAWAAARSGDLRRDGRPVRLRVRPARTATAVPTAAGRRRSGVHRRAEPAPVGARPPSVELPPVSQRRGHRALRAVPAAATAPIQAGRRVRWGARRAARSRAGGRARRSAAGLGDPAGRSGDQDRSRRPAPGGQSGVPGPGLLR
jgi:hypothetical protein